MTADVLDEHRAAAQLTRLDVDDLEPLAEIVAELHGGVVDADLDRAAVHLGVLLSLLPHRHVLLVAARAGVEVNDLRREHRRAMVEASHAIAGLYAALRARAEAGGTEVVQPGVGTERRGLPGEWFVPYDELLRRRFPPEGDVEAWILSGGTA